MMNEQEISFLKMVQATDNPEAMVLHIKALRDEGKITQKAYAAGMHWMKLPTEEDMQEASDYLKELQVEEEGKEE